MKSVSSESRDHLGCCSLVFTFAQELAPLLRNLEKTSASDLFSLEALVSRPRRRGRKAVTVPPVLAKPQGPLAFSSLFSAQLPDDLDAGAPQAHSLIRRDKIVPAVAGGGATDPSRLQLLCDEDAASLSSSSETESTSEEGQPVMFASY